MQTVIGGNKVSAKVTQSKTPLASQTLALLQAATNLDPNPEKYSEVAPVVGNALSADVVLSEGAQAETSTTISSYVVREGDTVSSIAQMFGVSANTLMWANGISRATALPVGQHLIILPVTGISYTVKKGDTIKGIATKYGADITEILHFNDISLGSTLVVGQKIIIPDAEQATPIKANTTLVKGYVRDNRAHDTNGPDYGSYYMRPCDISECVKSQGLHGHNAVDLASSYHKIGAPIYASAPGTVILSKMGGWNGGYGNYIIISHDNGTQTVYGHLSQTLAVAGQRVEKGQVIGYMGNSGNSTGPHLHFEIRGAKNPF
jgi:murein DD-endopeptidase MepM/ murein hydrolase activator NlpD